MAGLTTRHSLTCALGYRTLSWPRERRCGALALAVVRLISVSTLMGSATMSAFGHCRTVKHEGTKMKIADDFLDRGYVVLDVEDRPALDELQSAIVMAAARTIGLTVKFDNLNPWTEFLDTISITHDRLNAIRLHLYSVLNQLPSVRDRYFSLARTALEELVGNELVMQRNINLSIQVPHDKTSLLDIHADAFGGESPFQVVMWLPLVDCYRTKSMFILPRAKSEAITASLASFASMKAIHEHVKDDLVWLDVPYGRVLIFSPNCLHGNVVNEEETTRWSLNCRFKSLFSPYTSAEKSVGSFYMPIEIKSAT